jgi:segregation and condensation protein A
MNDEKYKVMQASFEGPLDLLLDLIEKRKLQINDIALAQITDDYIAFLEKQDEFPVKDTAEFVLVASTLLLIKSRSLLPGIELTRDEQEDIHDLEDRLKLLEETRRLATHIQERFGEKVLFFKTPSKVTTPIFTPDKNTNTGKLFESIKRVLEMLPVKEITPKAIVRKVISLEEVVESLIKRVQNNLKLSFNEFSKRGGGKAEKVEVIVTFLAMLELVKRGMIQVTQQDNFSDIEMETENIGVPRY